MTAYICVTYAQEDRELSDLFCRGLTRYGFRHRCINELSDPVKRKSELSEAALVVALTSPAAVRAESVAADIRLVRERQGRVLCVSLRENELDGRFCTGSEGGVPMIPYPAGETPDRHSLALFVHRLYVRHLASFGECFTESRCAEDTYGQTIRCACLAHKGDGCACYELGRAYEEGNGVPVLEKEAALWIRRAALRRVPDAMIHMGLLYLAGKGTERDDAAAFALFDGAARLGDVRGDYRKGLCYLEGLGVNKDPEAAVAYLKQAAESRDPAALYRLALLYRDGIGTPTDIRAALKCLRAACVAGCAACGGTFAVPSLYGRPAGKRYTCITMRHLRAKRGFDENRSVRANRPFTLLSADRALGRTKIKSTVFPEDRWPVSLATLSLPHAAELMGASRGGCAERIAEVVAPAAYALGLLLFEEHREAELRAAPNRALVWLRFAVGLGHVEACYHLGDAYRRGQGVPVAEKRAAVLFRLAADHHSERAGFALGVCYERGIGLEADPMQAVTYYEKAAATGYPPAQNNLGGCYEWGIGVVQNLFTAVEWYARAAAAELPEAICRLGHCYEIGRGVAADPEKAISLFERAAEQGHTYALYRLGLHYDRRARESLAVDSRQNALDVLQSAHTHGSFPEEDSLKGASEDLRKAIDFYSTASEKGLPEADYALYLYHRSGLGLPKDKDKEMVCLKRAAEGGCLQALYELGLACMEGKGLPKDQAAAVVCFTRAVKVWRAQSAYGYGLDYLEGQDPVPAEGLPLRRAAGGALYMLGYCILYGIGEGSVHTDVDPAVRPSAERVKTALPLFQEAAEIHHTGATTMLGDLYAYGVIPAAKGEDPLEYYLEADRAARVRLAHDTVTGDRTDSSVDALMTLAKRSLEAAEGEDDPGNVEMSLVNAWHCFSDSAKRGSVDALVGMAECLFHGCGAPRNRDAALKLLRRASVLNGGRIAASLWLGDYLRSQWGGDPDPEEADEVYVKGLEGGCVESECGPYTFGLRRVARREADLRLRAEVLYRLATLRAVYYSDGADRRAAFPYLAEAVVMGHTAALEDLARIYTYEYDHPRVLQREEEKRSFRFINPMGIEARMRRKLKKGLEDPTRSGRAAEIHRTWLLDYYTALWPEPTPFSYQMRSLSVKRDIPAYVTAPVTDLMRVNALVYLGECYLEGYGLPANPVAAVSCYRAALAIQLPRERNRSVPQAVINATYGLGWCLLYGVGTHPDPEEAVRRLQTIARNHGGAAYTLGLCYERGWGVIIPDSNEALKHYRKAQDLHHDQAADKVAALEKHLREQG